MQKQAKFRIGRVVASGPGHYKLKPMRQSGTLQAHTEETCAFVPNETKPNDRVIVPWNAGQDYALDISVPRHNLEQVYSVLGGERGQFRIVREQEIEAIIEDENLSEVAA